MNLLLWSKQTFYNVLSPPARSIKVSLSHVVTNSIINRIAIGYVRA